MAVSRYATHIAAPVPQSQPLPGREAEMARNDAGGFAFTIDDWKRLDRFLILGTEGGTYYADEKRLTLANAAVVRRCLKSDGPRTVQRIRDISQEGRAPKNDAAIVALALAAKEGDEATRQAAYKALPDVCRIGTHLFSFIEMRKSLGGLGAGARRALGRWYTERSLDSLAYQVVKYRQRNGWTHQRVLNLARPTPQDVGQEVIFDWLCPRPEGLKVDHYEVRSMVSPEYRVLPKIIEGFEKAQKATTAKELAAIVREYRLPRECVLPIHLNSIEVWDALLADMPMTAMIRNLGKMTSVGLLKPLSEASQLVCRQLGDVARLQKSRVHPMAILLAQRQYQAGRQSDMVQMERARHRYGTAHERDVARREPVSWSPIQQIVDALDDAFYASVCNVPVSGKRFLLAIDASGSMTSPISGYPISVREAAVAMALITAKAEPNHYFIGYTTRPIELRISPHMRLAEATKVVDRVAVGEGTDSSIPVQWAIREHVAADAIVQYTDGETWAGSTHPAVGMQHYRAVMVSDCRSVASGMTPTRTSIVDQQDPLSFDTVGLDANTAALIGSFCRGEF